MNKPSTKSPYTLADCYDFIDKLIVRDPEIHAEFKEKYKDFDYETFKAAPYSLVSNISALNPILGNLPTELEFAGSDQPTPESIVAAHRPVMIIRDNRIVPEFAGEDSSIWKDRIMGKEEMLNRIIPSVGRVEVNNNADYKWVGTGWLIDTDIIITNRHVAEKFIQNGEGFKFKVGYPNGFQSSRLDFLEEDQRNNSFEFDVDSVLWMSVNDNTQPDTAFLRLKHPINGPTLPKPIPLAKNVDEDEVIVAIGYPAYDISIPNLDLEQKVFHNVYEKKRLAPGLIIKVNDAELSHDCSTLGGSSGSALISLATGEAVGLHFGGIYMKANYAVPASKLNELLSQLKNGTLPRLKVTENTPRNNQAVSSVVPAKTISNSSNTYSIEFNIPIKITVEVGGSPLNSAVSGVNIQDTNSDDWAEKKANALEAAKQYLRDWSDVKQIRLGYRFRQGWITDEEVIVVEVREKKNLTDLSKSSSPVIPSEFLGVGVDVRSADIFDQLRDLNIDLKQESVPHSGAYREPPNLELNRVKEKMNAIFHVSPDSGFPNLRAFFQRLESKLTATMYEWDINHISDALFNAITGADGKLKMVTQKQGTRDAVNDMLHRLGAKFEHQWASVGSGKLIPSAYHIKVATRDNKEFWLSSGNWKDSNQANIDPAGENSTSIVPLREHNREWHVIIENENLATLFENYINWDFSEAQRVPVEEAVEAEPTWLIVPDDILEAPTRVRYFDPLIIKDRELDIQPLLTPDRDDRGRRIFMVFATALIQEAESSISIEDQSFSLLEDNDEAFERFFVVLKKKQDSGINIQIIFRDMREFQGSNMKIIERLKEFGFNTNNIKVQPKCHTKAIIIDPENETKAAVLFGSHNLTNSGALFNRDASLLVRDAEVTNYFKKIFDFDWDNLAKSNFGESQPIARRASNNEVPLTGFKKVLLDTLLERL